jgi:hypothetical protein
MSVVKVRTFDIETMEYPDNWNAPSKNTECAVCGHEVQIGDTLVTYDSVTRNRTYHTSLYLHPKCAEQLATVLVQDLAKIVDTEGFVLGDYMAPRADRIMTAVDKVVFAGNVLKPSR